MIYTGGNSIVSAYTNGVSVKEIYASGVKVWPVDEPTSYYIKWTPKNLTGTFSIEGTVYNFSDYNGYFSGFDGVITSSAFISTGITSVETNAYRIGYRAFYNCKSLSYASLSECEYISNYAFARTNDNNQSSFAFYAPVCSYIGNDAFLYRRTLSSLNAPNVEYLSNEAFAACGIVDYLYLSKCSYVGKGAFLENDFSKVSLPKCTYIGYMGFNNCGSLGALYLGGSSVCTLGSSFGACFYSTPVYVYVPRSLYSAYKKAQYWSDRTGRIFSY